MANYNKNNKGNNKSNKNNKGKLSLVEIFDSFTKDLDSEMKAKAEKDGFVLCISFQGLEKSAKGNADTHLFKGGFMSKSTKKEVTAFAASFNCYGIQKAEGKAKLVHFNSLGVNIPDSTEAEKYIDVPLNFKFNLGQKLRHELMNLDLNKLHDAEWTFFMEHLYSFKRVQLQMLVVKELSSEKEEPGKIEKMPGRNGNPGKDVYTIFLPKSDILVARLVTPSPAFLDKIDGKRITQKHLKGDVVQTDEENIKSDKSVDGFSYFLENQKSREKQYNRSLKTVMQKAEEKEQTDVINLDLNSDEKNESVLPVKEESVTGLSFGDFMNLDEESNESVDNLNLDAMIADLDIEIGKIQTATTQEDLEPEIEVDDLEDDGFDGLSI